MVFFIGFSSIAYVLQEPVGGQIAPEPLAPRRLVGRGGHGEELHALDIAALRIRDVLPRRPAAGFAADHVAETDIVAHSGHLRRAAALPLLSPAGILRAGDVSQPLVGRAELRPSHGRGRRAQAQRPVEAGKRRVVGPSADRYDVHARLEPLSADDRHGRIGAGRENVRFAIDRAWLIAGFALDAVALRDLGRKTGPGARSTFPGCARPRTRARRRCRISCGWRSSPPWSRLPSCPTGRTSPGRASGCGYRCAAGRPPRPRRGRDRPIPAPDAPLRGAGRAAPPRYR